MHQPQPPLEEDEEVGGEGGLMSVSYQAEQFGVLWQHEYMGRWDIKM